jgi:alanine racemase
MTQPLIPALSPPRPAPPEVAALRPTVVEVDTAALAHNLREVRRRVGPQVRIQAVVKADAYGHGAVPSARAFVEAGADWLGVALVEEGVELRRAGLLVPICVLSGLASPDDARAVVSHRLTPIVYRPDHLDAISAAAKNAGLARYPVHFKVDTGMGRWGALPGEVAPFLDALARHPELDLEGFATHFASADGDPDATLAQVRLFADVDASLQNRGFSPRIRHLANSAGLALADAHADMVRPGLALYGLGAPALRPALTLRTRIAHLKPVPQGFPVSYGATFVTSRDSILGVLPIGYADGLPRRVSNRAEVLVRGRRVPVVGRVCMDACMVDVTHVDGVQPGDEVVIIGRQGAVRLGADELATHADTISYEILTGIGKRVPRTYR